MTPKISIMFFCFIALVIMIVFFVSGCEKEPTCFVIHYTCNGVEGIVTKEYFVTLGNATIEEIQLMMIREKVPCDDIKLTRSEILKGDICK